MNHIYKVILNKNTGELVAVTEHAHAQGKGGKTTVRNIAPTKYGYGFAMKALTISLLGFSTHSAWAASPTPAVTAETDATTRITVIHNEPKDGDIATIHDTQTHHQAEPSQSHDDVAANQPQTIAADRQSKQDSDTQAIQAHHASTDKSMVTVANTHAEAADKDSVAAQTIVVAALNDNDVAADAPQTIVVSDADTQQPSVQAASENIASVATDAITVTASSDNEAATDAPQTIVVRDADTQQPFVQAASANVSSVATDAINHISGDKPVADTPPILATVPHDMAQANDNTTVQLSDAVWRGDDSKIISTHSNDTPASTQAVDLVDDKTDTLTTTLSEASHTDSHESENTVAKDLVVAPFDVAHFINEPNITTQINITDISYADADGTPITRIVDANGKITYVDANGKPVLPTTIISQITTTSVPVADVDAITPTNDTPIQQATAAADDAIANTKDGDPLANTIQTLTDAQGSLKATTANHTTTTQTTVASHEWNTEWMVPANHAAKDAVQTHDTAQLTTDKSQPISEHRHGDGADAFRLHPSANRDSDTHHSSTNAATPSRAVKADADKSTRSTQSPSTTHTAAASNRHIRPNKAKADVSTHADSLNALGTNKERVSPDKTRTANDDLLFQTARAIGNIQTQAIGLIGQISQFEQDTHTATASSVAAASVQSILPHDSIVFVDAGLKQHQNTLAVSLSAWLGRDNENMEFLVNAQPYLWRHQRKHTWGLSTITAV